MSLIKNGIEKVRVFEVPNGIREDGRNIGAVRTALVKWSAKVELSDKFYQIYVNGQYAGTTVDTQQRQMIVQIPCSFESAVRIEVFAVVEEESYIDFSSEIESSGANSGRVKITFFRSQYLLPGSTAQVYFDNGTGQIDFDRPLNKRPIGIWPSWRDKCGFCMSRFGFGDFGYDGAAAVGWGQGVFGKGRFGFDTDTIEWVSRPLSKGEYKFAVKIIDERGNESASSEVGSVTAIPMAKPAEKLSILSYDKQAEELVLNIL